MGISYSTRKQKITFTSMTIHLQRDQNTKSTLGSNHCRTFQLYWTNKKIPLINKWPLKRSACDDCILCVWRLTCLCVTPETLVANILLDLHGCNRKHEYAQIYDSGLLSEPGQSSHKWYKYNIKNKKVGWTNFHLTFFPNWAKHCVDLYFSSYIEK